MESTTISRMDGQELRRPSVIVIGGGIAGLAAARTLQDACFKVNLLESRNRIGGRIHTDYSFSFPVDLGASWLHGASMKNPLAPVIARLQLPMYRTSGDNSILYDHDLQSYALFDIDGNRVPAELVAEVGNVFEALVEESKKLREELKEDVSIARAFSAVLERRPDLRLEGLSQNVLQWYICRMEGWFAADANGLSVNCWDEELLDGGHALMVSGYGPVLQHLASGLDIHLNERVRRIKEGSSDVRVITEGGREYRADAVVVTLPLGVLKSGSVEFEPELPNWKREAVEGLGVGNENKIALRFSEAFWPDVDFLGVVASTSYGCSYFLNLHKSTRCPVLVYMPAGRLADELEKLGDELAVQFAVEQLKRILPQASQPIGYKVTQWGSDPSSLGCYSHDKVGNPHDLYAMMRLPVGKSLFFAGEATSASYPGTVHGAYLTGIQAAHECRHYLLPPPTLPNNMSNNTASGFDSFQHNPSAISSYLSSDPPPCSLLMKQTSETHVGHEAGSHPQLSRL